MRRVLKDILAAGLQTHTLAAFIAYLLTNGVSPLPTLDGCRVVGLVYRYKGKNFPDTDLGQDFSWENISRMLGYDEQDDYEILQALVEVDELAEEKCVLEHPDQSDEARSREQQRLQSDAYLLVILNLLIAHLIQFRRSEHALIFHLEGGGRIVDKGNRVYAYGLQETEADRWLLGIAQVKNWQTMSANWADKQSQCDTSPSPASAPLQTTLGVLKKRQNMNELWCSRTEHPKPTTDRLPPRNR